MWYYMAIKNKEEFHMGVFIVIAVILCAPFMLFSPDLDSEAKFMAFVISIGFSLPLFLFIFNLFNTPVPPEDKKKISNRTKKEKKIENEYGIIDWDDKS